MSEELPLEVEVPESFHAECHPPEARRKPRRWLRWLWLLLPVLAVTILGVGYVLVALRREPEFYRASRAALQDEAVREAAVAELTVKAEQLEAAVERRQDWSIEITEQQLNAWLMQEYPRQVDERSRSKVKEPLVDLSEGRLRVGAMVDTDRFNGIVSLDLQPRLEADETLIIDVQSIRVGDVPVPATQLIAEISRHFDQSKWPVTIETEPSLRVVVPLRELDRGRRQLMLTAVELGEDRVTLSGAAPQEE